MRIQHNIPAMNAYRNYTANTKAVSKNLEKLSSGYRINRAGDDAAGLAISEKMRAQVTGLKTAQKNAKDGISLVQTAEGALTEVHSMLNRMVELADQSANGTYDDSTDRNNLQKEFNALRSEVDRISKATNFNGISLLNGSQESITSVTDAPVGDIIAADNKNGATASAATKASFTVKLDAAVAAGGTGGLAGLQGDTTTNKALGEMMIDGVAVKDLFTATVGGTAIDWTDAVSKVASGAEIVFTAKTAGAMSDATVAAFTGLDDASNVTATNGTDEGAGAAATKAKYDLVFDFAKLAAGQTFTIGDKTFEITLDGAVTAGNTAININGFDLSDTATSGGQANAAAAIQTAVATELGGDFTSSAPAAGDIASGKYTLNLTASTAGTAGNLGQVRVSNAATGAITGTHTAGKLEGPGQPGSFASVSYDFDVSKLALGDKLKIGDVEIEITSDADADADPNDNKISLATAQDGATLSAAFETAGYSSGKITIDTSTKKMTITGTATGQTAEDLAAGQGKVTFTAKNPSSATTSGGLTLQIGDTSDSYNQITVSIGKIDCETLGIDASKININEQEKASASVAVIKNAINSVSSTRGDLGAVQNRLEHTINNLSVMTENIQDAESSIRDVDVAEEMMAYTKNNILVQSAQAMLAQANQLPQGVLQLLG